MSTFRASCDNCATSKVRCGKEQPYCQRCFRLGQICIYSPSQRSRRRTHLDQTEQMTILSPQLLHSSEDMTMGTSPDFMNMLEDNSGLFSDFDTNHSLLQCDLSQQESRVSEGSTRSDDSGQQHCELAILHMLMELGTPSPCRGRPRSSRDLGAILKTSRKTLACASKVLECNTCPKSTNAALLVTTLLLHTLSWYDVILQDQGLHPTGDGEYGGMIVDTLQRSSSEPNLSLGVSSEILVPPMLIGSYELDAESQGRMVCQVILGDLNKIDGLAKIVATKLRDADTAASSPEASQAPDLMGAVIRQRHCQLLRVIKRKLEIPGV